MRNLKLKYNQRYSEQIPNSICLLINPNSQKTNDIRYVVTGDKLVAFAPGVKESHKVLAEVPQIVAAEYLALDNEICLATGGGEVLQVNLDTLAFNEGTFCDVGIECMSWSPDQEVVAFVTKEHNVVVMTCTYEPLNEHSLNDDSLQTKRGFVNVGWGKKETQFHGSEGKQAAKQKPDDQLSNLNIEDLPKDIIISWRADCRYFVVSYVSQTRGRSFKVFDKEGKLQYVAEKQSNIYPATAWRPSGNWIAVPQKLPNKKSVIALFEKNGLRHREFILTFDVEEEPILDIKWSLDSEILSIRTDKRLYLYTIGNYHWYLKQVLDFENNSPIAFYNWDCRIGEENTLHILLANGEYLIYKWFWSVDRLERTGLVAVIDGRHLLLTDFSKAIIPPPMCTQELHLQGDAFIAALTFTAAQDEIHLSLYDSSHNVHYYKSGTKQPTDFIAFGCLELQPLVRADMIPLQYANIQWFESFEDTHLVASFTRDNVSKVHFLTVDVPDSYKLKATLNVNGTISSLQPAGKDQPCELFFQVMETNEITRLVYDIDSNRQICRVSFAQLDHTIELMDTYIKSCDAMTQVIGLTRNQCLFINAKRVVTDVTSFCLAGNYLAYTKLSSLHFLRWSDLKLIDERRMERGAKLVTTISQSARTVVQMPRGNLEVICPRLLSLELVGGLLEAKRYCEAFDMLRKQRINLNIICDHNMPEFVDKLDLFLAEIQKSNWLNLFLNDLLNEDLTTTMYAYKYEQGLRHYPEGFKIEEKISYICKEFCKRMEQSGEKRFRLPLITAYVKLKELEKALEIIWEEKKRENPLDEEYCGGGAEEALTYLLYLVDVNELYKVALGTYDFGLVLFVAQKSQKDPKEYLAFLNELKGYEINYRKFKIDEHLKRFEKALYHVASCGKEKFVEALSFIKRHEYYPQALRAFRDDQECYQQICLAFGDHLRSNGKLLNASILYERGGNIQQALLSAKHTLDWQRAIALAKQSEQNEAAVALSMVAPLQEQGRYLEAYEICKKYSENTKESLQCLLKGNLFLHAIFETQMLESNTEKEELLQTFIGPELLQYHANTILGITADKELFLTHTMRLAEVRQNRLKRSKLLAEGGQVDIDECDLISDTTSMHSSRYSSSSRGTGKTFRSSKNRRKHERKLLSLKPGNPFEDIALIDALYNQITRCYSLQMQISDTCKALLQLQLDPAAYELQNNFKSLLTIMENSLDAIWIPEILQSSSQQFLQGPNIDYTQLQNEQRYALINPIKRFKPQLNPLDWEHDILH